MMDLKNKYAIITGASKGIGLATAQALLNEGVKVTGWSRSGSAIENNANYFHLQVDVANHDQVEKAYNATKQHWKAAPDMLINNAGRGYEGAIDEIPLERWHEMVNININGIFYCSRHIIPDLKQKQESHIVNISSIAGTTGIPNMSGYCGTKHAVKGISHSMFKELRQYGIKVTCIYPGSVQTNFFDPIDSVTANENMMQPQDIASTVIHCLSSPPNYHHVDIEVRPLKPKG